MFTLQTLKRTYSNVFLSMLLILQVSTTSICEHPESARLSIPGRPKFLFCGVEYTWLARTSRWSSCWCITSLHLYGSSWGSQIWTIPNDFSFLCDWDSPNLHNFLLTLFMWAIPIDAWADCILLMDVCADCIPLTDASRLHTWHTWRLHTIDVCADCISWLSDRRAGMGGHNSFSTCKWNCENQHNGLAWSIRIHKHHRILASTVISNCKGTEIH